ncbi:MAG: hypothetical protein E7127_07295 [Rikenellaceae bacterium]|nr:hypothetical protein [Rikenellaceae bacterium]
MLKRLSKILSAVFHPSFVPIYLVALLLFADSVYDMFPLRIKFYLLWVVALYALVIPFVGRALLKRADKWGGGKIKHLRSKAIPLLIGTCCYLLCAITLMKSPSLIMFRKIALAAAMSELFCLLTLPFWRASLHMTAMGAATAALVTLNIIGAQNMFWVMMASIIITGMLASARLYLGRNNGIQILAGFIGGFAVSAVTMLFF